MSRFVLGTAQIGLDYGVNNKHGKPSLEEAFDILDAAYESGIRMLDTAAAYGNSEDIIGRYMKEKNRHFRIASKLSNIDCKNLRKSVHSEICKTRDRLGINHIDYYFVHKFSDIADNPELLEALHNERLGGTIGNVGVSVYGTDEVIYLLENHAHEVDAIQIPFNVFDLRWMRNSLLQRTKELGMEVFARSIYLQGLMFLDEQVADRIHSKAFYYIKLLQDFCLKKGITVSEFAMFFATAQDIIDYTVIGCETKEQLITNVELFRKEYDNNTKAKAIEFVYQNFSDVETGIIDPRLWPSAKT